MRWIRSNQPHLRQVAERARPYLYFIVEEVAKRDLPMELALLPFIESGFHPLARSPNRAAGLWQFMPATARWRGLHRSWWYDGRRDLVASTNAALDYLRSLADRFDGDWELALAAYNAGSGTVRRAVRWNQRAGKDTDYWSLSLPRETMDYVPRLLAVCRAVSEPALYGLELPEIPDRPQFTQVGTGAQIDLALAAEIAGIPLRELRRLNPGFRRWATAPAGPHRLLLPIDKAGQFTARLKTLPPEERVAWDRYRIRPGDTLGTIARALGTTLTTLKQANRLTGNRIRAGRYLLIPVSRAGDEPGADSNAAGTAQAARKEDTIVHQVRSGDTLWDIARGYQVAYRQLAAWNQIDPGDTLRPGQRLQVRMAASRKPRPQPAVVQSPGPTLSYEIRKGDSLYLIARRFKVSIRDLRRWNRLSGKYLKPGQRLILYLRRSTSTL